MPRRQFRVKWHHYWHSETFISSERTMDGSLLYLPLWPQAILTDILIFFKRFCWLYNLFDFIILIVISFNFGQGKTSDNFLGNGIIFIIFAINYWLKMHKIMFCTKSLFRFLWTINILLILTDLISWNNRGYLLNWFPQLILFKKPT